MDLSPTKKTAFCAASIGVFIAAALLSLPVLVVFGAVLFTTMYVLQLRHLVRSARTGDWLREQANKPQRSGAEYGAAFLEGTIIVAALLALVSGNVVQEPAIILGGAIIWIGQIVIWMLSGILVERATGIPLRLRYGRWEVAPKRRRYRRRVTPRR